MTVVRMSECITVKRKMSASLPTWFVAAVATERDCGEIILPQTPPEELAATVTTGSTPIWVAVTSCSFPNRAFAEVSEPVMNTPSQPRNAAKKGKRTPVFEKASPRVTAMPEKFMM
jgi:hypothetical protein